MPVLSYLLDEYLEEHWRRDPVAATGSGVHTHDHELPCFDPDAIADGYQKDTGLCSALAQIDETGLSTDELLDLKVALANLRRSCRDHEVLKLWARDPGIYVSAVVEGVYSLVQREHAPLEERLRAILSRLSAAPTLLRQGQANLTAETPPVFAETALGQAAGGIRFLESAVPQLARQVPALEHDLERAGRAALAALAEYALAVRSLLPGCRGQFGIGREHYDFLLRDYHLLALDSAQLLALGQEAIPRTLSELEVVARQVDPRRSWLEITAELKADHPANEGLLAMYQHEVDLARAFVLEKDLVTVPEDEGFWAIWTPPFMWSTIPFGNTCAPRPFEPSNKGLWQITPADPNTPAEVQEQKLQGHNRWNARAIALHEGYPGHHMNFCIIKRLPSRVRRQFWDTVFIEGWGLYTEELMWESGFLADPRLRLIQLVNALWRAVRVVVDVSLHTLGMPLQESIDMLVDVSRLERVNAVAETVRYAAWPTQASSYLLGKTLIMELRAACRAQSGAAFSLKRFHDRLLSYGAISPSLVRQIMLAA